VGNWLDVERASQRGLCDHLRFEAVNPRISFLDILLP
jgi:hypothetical protein